MPVAIPIVAILVATAVSTAVSVALQAIMKALQGQPADPGRTVSVREPTSARRVIYGQCRVGSVFSFLHLTGSHDSPNQYMCIVQTICGHEIQSLDEICFDGFPVEWGGYNTTSNMPNFYVEIGKYAGNKLWGDWKLGKPCEPAFPGLIGVTTRDSSGLWTSAHRQDGCASAVLILSWDTNVFPNGVPSITYQVKGKKLYDPRTGTTVYSKNAALAIYDFLTNKQYGLGVDTSEVNTASVIAAANICDESVPRRAGGSEPRYEVNGMFSVDAQPTDVLNALAQAMAGSVIFSQGQWYLIPGVWQSPVVSLNDDDLRGPLQIQTLRPKRELCNAVQGTIFANDLTGSAKYQKVNFPPVVHPVPLCQDSGHPNANQRGYWATGTAYAIEDCAVDATPRSMMGIWAPATLYHVNDYVRDTTTGLVYVCTQTHTSSAAGANPPTANGNEPGVGQLWTSYWADTSATFSEFRGGVYVCTAAHTSSAVTEPGIGATWASYWVEMTEYIWKDIELNFTSSSPMAQRIAKITLERSRHQTTAVLKCKLSAFQLQPGDTFHFSHARYGWDNATFQVLQSDFVVDDQNGAPLLGIDLKVQMVDASIYAWDQTTEEQTLGQPAQPTIPDTEIPRATPAAYGPGVTWSTTTTTVQFVWDYTGGDAIVLLDQANTEYNPVGNQTVTGLTADTAYKFYPYYNRALAIFSGAMSDGVGTPAWLEVPPRGGSASITAASVSGSGPYIVTITSTLNPGINNDVLISGLAPDALNGFQTAIASSSSTFQFVLAADPGTITDGVGTAQMVPASVLRARTAEWQRDGNIPLAISPLDVFTPSSGSGGGGGGGDGGCLRVGMFVEEVNRGPIRCEDVKVGDRLLSQGGRWLEVFHVEPRPHEFWAEIRFSNGAELTVTTGHPFTLAMREEGTMKRASELSLEDALFSLTGIAYPRSIAYVNEKSEKVIISLEVPHTFYASKDGVNWVLAHNIQKSNY